MRTFADAGEVEVSVFENQILFTDGDATLTTRLVEGEYPRYRQIIPESTEGKTVVSRDQILSAAAARGTAVEPEELFDLFRD